MTEQQFQEILGKMDRLARVAALCLVAGRKQAEQVLLLSKAGFRPKEIAGILGTTQNTVSVALSTMRKTTSKRR